MEKREKREASKNQESQGWGRTNLGAENDITHIILKCRKGNFYIFCSLTVYWRDTGKENSTREEPKPEGELPEFMGRDP